MDPEHADLEHARGVAEYLAGRAAKALSHFDRAIAAEPTRREFHVNRGNALRELGRHPEAATAFQRALDLDPDYAEAACNLAGLHAHAGRLDEAITGYATAAAADPRLAEAYQGWTWALATAGRASELSAVYEAWHRADPEHPVAAHLYAASHGAALTGAGATHVAELFDTFAPAYDRTLTALDYRVPEAIAAALSGREFEIALDIGCGTGLSGQRLRAQCRRLIGVDLSRAMLELAAQKNIYDELVCGDAIEELAARGPFDLVVAADVLPYVGDIERLVAAVADALRHGGLFALTFEHGGTESELAASGRYRQAQYHVRTTLLRAELEIVSSTALPLRREGEDDVHGHLIVAAR